LRGKTSNPAAEPHSFAQGCTVRPRKGAEHVLELGEEGGGGGRLSLVKNNIVGINEGLAMGPFGFEILEIDRLKEVYIFKRSP